MGLFSKGRKSARAADVEARSLKAKGKALAQHEARWHMRPGAANHREASDVVRDFCFEVGFVQRATVAEVRESENDPVRLLIGLRVTKEVQPRFSEVAGALRRSLKAKVPEERAVEVEALDAEVSASTPYDVFP